MSFPLRRIVPLRMVAMGVAWAGALLLAPTKLFTHLTSGWDVLLRFTLLSLYVWTFPAGLLAVLRFTLTGLQLVVFLTCTWLLYAILTVVTLSVNRTASYWRLYLCLCALLILNISGCRILCSERAPGTQPNQSLQPTVTPAGARLSVAEFRR